MKRLVVMCMALVLAFAPAATADAAKGKKGKAAAKSCLVKKTAKGKKAKKARKACAKAKKKATKKAGATDPQQAAAERECRADRRLDAEGFAADFGTGKDAVARCAAELLEQLGADEPLEEDEPLEGDDILDDGGPIEDPLDPAAASDDAPLDDEPIE
jgi:hypothetical protein